MASHWINFSKQRLSSRSRAINASYTIWGRGSWSKLNKRVFWWLSQESIASSLIARAISSSSSRNFSNLIGIVKPTCMAELWINMQGIIFALPMSHKSQITRRGRAEWYSGRKSNFSVRFIMYWGGIFRAVVRWQPKETIITIQANVVLDFTGIVNGRKWSL